jgi:glycosyltransferase involved in cell wall biosynthesis
MDIINRNSRKKTVFFVINTLEGGGAERVLSTLAIDFHNRKIPVKIVCLNYAETVYKLPKDLEVTYLLKRSSNSKTSRIYYACITFLKLSYLFLNEKPECVISFMTTSNLWSGLSAMITKTDFIVSERTTPEHSIKTQNYIFKAVLSIIYRNARAIVVPAKGIESCLKMYSGFEKLSNFKIIHNPITDLGNPSKLKVNNRKFIFGAGRLSHEKGFDRLIDAFAALKLKNIDLLIAGEGQEYEVLKQKIQYLRLQKKVKLIGLKSNLQDYYAQAELFVLPSRNEGYPNALIEAMSFGCACIAMDCEFGPSEIIRHQKNGLLVQKDNVKELRSGIIEILTDTVLKDRIAINAKKINKTNSLKSISTQWQNIIFST